MNGLRRRLTPIVTVVLLWGVTWVWAQSRDTLNQQLVKSYDLLEAGRLEEARKIFEDILRKRPGEPLALNNLAALLVKQGRYEKAVGLLERALKGAQGYRLKVNQVCDLSGLCLAFRPALAEYGDRDLAPLVKINLELVKAKLAAPKPGK